MRRKNGSFGCVCRKNNAGSKGTKNVRSFEGIIRMRSPLHLPAFEVFQNRDYRFFLLARIFYMLAPTTITVVIGWLVYQHTRDELSLGFIGLAEAIPMLGVSLVGGYVADRVNRQRIVTVAAGGLALCIALLMLVAWRFEAVYAVAGLWPVYVLIAGTGLVRAFMAPSQSALNAQLVPQAQIMYAANWNGTVFNIANMGGPALGGIIYGFFGPVVALATLFVYAIIGMILFMQVTPQSVMPRPAGETMLQSMQEGLKYVFSRQMLVGALALDMFAVLFGGAVALLPVFAERLGAGPVGLGFLRAAPAVGAVLISFWIARFPPAKHAGRDLLLSIAGFGACMIAFALSQSYVLSFALLLLSGALDGISMVVRATVVQLYTPNELRGRVEAVNRLFISSSNEIGAFESGLAARLMGLEASVIFGGAMTLVCVGIAAAALPRLRKLRL